MREVKAPYDREYKDCRQVSPKKSYALRCRKSDSHVPWSSYTTTKVIGVYWYDLVSSQSLCLAFVVCSADSFSPPACSPLPPLRSPSQNYRPLRRTSNHLNPVSSCPPSPLSSRLLSLNSLYMPISPALTLLYVKNARLV